MHFVTGAYLCRERWTGKIRTSFKTATCSVCVLEVIVTATPERDVFSGSTAVLMIKWLFATVSTEISRAYQDCATRFTCTVWACCVYRLTWGSAIFGNALVNVNNQSSKGIIHPLALTRLRRWAYNWYDKMAFLGGSVSMSSVDVMERIYQMFRRRFWGSRLLFLLLFRLLVERACLLLDMHFLLDFYCLLGWWWSLTQCQWCSCVLTIQNIRRKQD
jgi:hypothetical protein